MWKVVNIFSTIKYIISLIEKEKKEILDRQGLKEIIKDHSFNLLILKI